MTCNKIQGLMIVSPVDARIHYVDINLYILSHFIMQYWIVLLSWFKVVAWSESDCPIPCFDVLLVHFLNAFDAC